MELLCVRTGRIVMNVFHDTSSPYAGQGDAVRRFLVEVAGAFMDKHEGAVNALPAKSLKAAADGGNVRDWVGSQGCM